MNSIETKAIKDTLKKHPELFELYGDIKGDLDKVEKTLRLFADSPNKIISEISEYLFQRAGKRLRPALLARLYRSDAEGFQDLELCEEVGSILFARCETFRRVAAREVACPACGTVFRVAQHGASPCPGVRCDWQTDFRGYRESIRNHYAATGRAMDAYETFRQKFSDHPRARVAQEQINWIRTYRK